MKFTEENLEQAICRSYKNLDSLTYNNIVRVTSNDHIFNGVRVAVKKGIISHEEVYFEEYVYDPIGNIVKHRVLINKDGSLDSLPKGFFDQFNNELDMLLED
jgi:predicted ATPase